MKPGISTTLILMFTTSLVDADGWYAIWDRAGATWYEKWDHVLDSIETFPEKERMDLLGRAAAFGSDDRMSDQKREIFERSQAMLLAIPGHAEFYRDRINSARERMESLLAAGDEGSYPAARYQLSNEVMFGFDTLKQLPSVETVRVLGEFLFDERGYVKVPLENTTERQRYESVKHSPVYRISAATLAALPIVGKLERPLMIHGSPEDTQPWKQWYLEIKEGRRTFRFEGDPTEYDLNGPAPLEKTARIARDRTREAERQSGSRRAGLVGEAPDQAAQAAPKWPLAASLFAGGLVIFGTMMWISRKRRIRS